MIESSVIDDNVNTENESFLDYLHERNEFNIEAFKELVLELIAITKISTSLSNDDFLNIFRKVFDIYDYTLRKFIYNKAVNNLSKIVNYDEELMVFNYLPKFEFVVKSLLKKDYKSIEEYVDEFGTLNDW